MASATATTKMREEATCSICLELMTDPLSINCGHSFCRRCIEDILENCDPMTSSQENFPCPLCRTPFRRQSLRPNRQLENLIESIRELEQERLCEEHGEQLHLFCEDDGQLICWHCERSPRHRGHNTALVKDICPGDREELQEVLTKLTALQEECKNWIFITSEKIEEWEEKTNLQRQKIQCDFEKLHIFLCEKEKYYLQELERERKQTLKRLQDSKASLAKQYHEVDRHILELEKKYQSSAQKLLQDVKDTLSRTSAVKLEPPEDISLEISTAHNFSKIFSDMKKTFLAPGQDGSTVKHGACQGQNGVDLGTEMHGSCGPQCQRRPQGHIKLRKPCRPPQEQTSPGCHGPTASNSQPSTTDDPCQGSSQEETQ
ncbi:PREDICTED: E3 ubiquitin-protein ligase TRIM38-like [Condylura cristata]|uniref:E3 ubiquitin-protein ligase TRIM38-like n=1 Tax=Condylura cristata TaxID=143302 RepID=UPI000643A2DF|nr:PREDICTED: E3 ubiquitin-protein ligase TRIM38-like [Condylura cristata]